MLKINFRKIRQRSNSKIIPPKLQKKWAWIGSCPYLLARKNPTESLRTIHDKWVWPELKEHTPTRFAFLSFTIKLEISASCQSLVLWNDMQARFVFVSFSVGERIFSEQVRLINSCKPRIKTYLTSRNLYLSIWKDECYEFGCSFWRYVSLVGRNCDILYSYKNPSSIIQHLK